MGLGALQQWGLPVSDIFHRQANQPHRTLAPVQTKHGTPHSLAHTVPWRRCRGYGRMQMREPPVERLKAASGTRWEHCRRHMRDQLTLIDRGWGGEGTSSYERCRVQRRPGLPVRTRIRALYRVRPSKYESLSTIANCLSCTRARLELDATTASQANYSIQQGPTVSALPKCARVRPWHGAKTFVATVQTRFTTGPYAWIFFLFWLFY
jgi:hypothetical protein